jgi:hypothetical protein
MNKPRRECIFCDNPVESKEHIWSTWMHPLLQGDPNGKYNRHTITRFPDGQEAMTGPTDKPGNAFNIQVRAVCASCNNGWMSRREGEVKPFLEKMIVGAPVTLTEADTETLAKWCAQKFIVMEHSQLQTSLTPKNDRVALRKRGDIPPYFRIYVGNHDSASRSGSIRHSHTLALSPEGPLPPLNGTERNIQTISILMGRLFVHLNAARVDGFEIEKTYDVSRVWNECRIWPSANTAFAWPHRPLLNDDGLFIIGNTLETIFQGQKDFGRLTWLGEVPTGT